MQRKQMNRSQLKSRPDPYFPGKNRKEEKEMNPKFGLFLLSLIIGAVLFGIFWNRLQSEKTGFERELERARELNKQIRYH